MFKAKKGLFASDQLTWVLIFMFVFTIAISVFYIGNILSQSKKQKQIEVSIEDFNANYNLNHFLRMPVDEQKNVGDLISEAYISNDYKKIKILADGFFKEVYSSRGLGYDVYIEGRSVNSIDFASTPASSEVQIPLSTQGLIKVELLVGKPILIRGDLTSIGSTS